MIIVMKENATVAQIGKVIRGVEDMGLFARPSRGENRTVIGVVGAADESQLAPLGLMDGVEQISPYSRAFKLVHREFRAEPTVISLGDFSIGGPEFVVMAGPCAVESEAQVLETAREVESAGARVLRGGAFKPRTSPYSFKGLGEEGLRILRTAGERTGLKVITEVMAPEQVPLVSRYADILQIGTRNMQNYALLEAVGRVRQPVMLKRGMMSTIEELLLAAEYILANGNSQVILCERGIRTFERATRNTCDISAIPVIKAQSHLPVVVDPSHAAGVRAYVPALSRAALAAGADGIIVEVHPRPEEALSDGAQSLTPDGFRALMDELRAIAGAVGRTVAACRA
ncbi:3-deoxy-7-phosphoheptulonate synthase [bacterium]|nr:3-deoxy-7-phosphoheptulonate synthase [bacterium]